MTPLTPKHQISRTTRIAVYLTPSEESEIIEASQATGLAPSAFMRSVALERARAK